MLEKIEKYTQDKSYDGLEYNKTPTEEEVTRIVKEKKNNKSTTDVKNEMIKRPQESMIKFLYPMIETIWEEEQIPDSWNTGNITSVWKGKGDKEKLDNHRGITTSSSIGTIFDSFLDSRIEALVPFTQAQGRGKKGASTCM